MDRPLQQAVDRLDQIFFGRNRSAEIDEGRHFVGSRFDQPAGGCQATDELREGVSQIAHG